MLPASVVAKKQFKMSATAKIFTALLLIVAIGFAAMRFWPQKAGQVAAKSAPANIIMAIDGDPRLRVCQSASDAELASPKVVNALNIATPLALTEENKAIYRVSVLRENGDSFAVTFSTPDSSIPGKVLVVKNSASGTQTERQNLIYEQAVALVDAFEKAKIWGAERPTIKPNKVTAPASAVIEIAAPDINKCVTTRYDDEHIEGLMAEFMHRVPSVLTKVSLDGFAAPKQEILGQQK